MWSTVKLFGSKTEEEKEESKNGSPRIDEDWNGKVEGGKVTTKRLPQSVSRRRDQWQ